jgi:hypothetical protein
MLLDMSSLHLLDVFDPAAVPESHIGQLHPGQFISGETVVSTDRTQ